MFGKNIVVCIASAVLMVSLSGCGNDSQTHSQASPTPPQVEYSATLEPKDLLGTWVAGNGKAVFESKADGSLKVTNETGMISSGTISADTLTAPEWNVTGRLSKDKKTFIWSNGAIWTK